MARNPLVHQAKVTKAQAKYTPEGTRAEHCGICQHFKWPTACEVVEGEVSRNGWCRFFEKRGK